MALFRSARREPEAPAAATPAAPRPAPASAPAATPPAEASRAAQQRPAIAGTLREIVAAAVAPEDALQPALEAIVGSMGAGAGAVCLYDARRELLRLAVETGLSDEGCKRLRNVRRNDPVTWDMPLNALLNRRVYLIDNASQNRYVPPLIEPAAGMRTVVCIPLLAGVNQLGALILITTGNRGIHERDLQALQEGLRELAALIESVRRQGIGEPPPSAGGPAAPSPFVPKAGAGGEAPPAPALTVPTRSVADAQALADRIAAAKLRRQTAPADAPPAGPAPSAAASAEVQAELQRVRTTLALVEAARDEARAEVAKLATDVEDLSSLLAASTAERTQSEATLREIAERAEAAAAAERERSEALEATIREKPGAPDLQSTLDQAWADLRRAIEERDAALREVDRLRTEVERLETALTAATEEHSRLAGEGESSRGRAAALEQALEAEQAHAREAQERERTLELQLSAAGAERVRLEEEAESLKSREATNLERIADFEGQITLLQTAKAASATTVAGLEDQIHGLEQQCSTLADQNRALAARLEELVSASLRPPVSSGEPSTEAAVPRVTVEAAPSSPAPEVAPPAAAGDAPAASAPAPPPAPAAPPPRTGRVVTLRPVRAEPAPEAGTPGTLVIVGGGPAWEALASGERQVVCIPPDDDLAARLGDLPGARVLVDLAVPGALERMAAARQAGSPARFWGCVTTADGGRAARLGMIEPTPRPLDPDAVLELLAGYGGRGTRVFTAGADADALISLRQALSRQGMSVSIAWDAKQATDMLGVVRPDVAVIDLDIPPREGYGLVLQLGSLEPLATVVLVHASEDIPAGFAAAIADRTAKVKLLALEALASDVLKRSEASIPARR